METWRAEAERGLRIDRYMRFLKRRRDPSEIISIERVATKEEKFVGLLFRRRDGSTNLVKMGPDNFDRIYKRVDPGR